MKKTMNSQDFTDAFKNMGRENQFSFSGLRALFDYIEEFEQETDEEYELDVIALCCEFSEYKDIAELKEEREDVKDLEDLEEKTQVIFVDDRSEVEGGSGRFIVQDF